MIEAQARQRVSTPLLSAMAIAGLAAGPALSADLYSNARLANHSDPGLATGLLTASGLPAPIGKVWSELQAVSTASANAVAGFAGHDSLGGYRFADDVIVSDVWAIDEVVFYAYASDAASANPFAGVNLRIWSGEPELPGSTLRFGDVTNNRMISATRTNLLRIFSTQVITDAPLPPLPTTERAIWELRVAIDPPLTARAETLWLDWQIMMSSPQLAAFAPSITVPGRRTRVGTPSSNARQLRLSGAPVLADAWIPLIDNGKPWTATNVAQDLPFILRGSVLPAPCSPADIATDDGIPLISATAQSSNNGVTEGDYNAFFAGFFDALLYCDIANDEGSPRPPFGTQQSNNGVTEGDYNLFFSLFFDGCAQ